MWSPTPPNYRPYGESGSPFPGTNLPGAVPPGAAPPGNAPPPQQMTQPRPKRSGRKSVGIAAIALVGALIGGTGGVVIGHDLVSGNSSTATTANTTATDASAKLSSSTISAIAAHSLPSVVEVKEQTSSGEGIGSGVILSADGLILTNNHVVSDAANGGTLTVTFSNGKTASATIVGTSSSSDLAVIKAQNVSGLTPAALGDSSSVKVGDGVIAIGAPEGLQNTVTSGIVSYLNRKVTVQSDSSSNPYAAYNNNDTVSYNAIQTDASINPGNSGGPLINSAGQVIGINSAIYSPTSSQDTQGGSVGLGFAIPINTAKTIIQQLEAGQSS
jgi:putative serine protease PepD